MANLGPIYNFNSRHSSPMESIGNSLEANGKRVEERFIEEMADLVADVLEITWRDKRIFNSAFKAAVKKDMTERIGHPGLLEQYKAYVLDAAAKSMLSELNAPEGVGVNHDYADHAKLSPITEWIKDNYRYDPGWRKAEGEAKRPKNDVRNLRKEEIILKDSIEEKPNKKK